MASRPIEWRLHLRSAPEIVYAMLTTDEGRARFWAERTIEHDGTIDWEWPGEMAANTPIFEIVPPTRFRLGYFGGSTVTFTLTSDGIGGTHLHLIDEEVMESDWEETHAGWVSVLMALKGAVDFGIDLRNHAPAQTWDQGYVDN